MERGNHKPGRLLAVVGATGYIGRKLTLELLERDEPVRAVARSPEKAKDLDEAGAEVVKADVLEDEGLAEALADVSIAYYLVHSMGRGASDDSFAERDKQGAENFGQAAKAAGVDLIVYLGGLSDGGSKHLASRHESAEILQASGVPVTYVRAAAVIGAGSESFLIPYYLVKRLPAMVTPRWARTKTQPVSIADAVQLPRRYPENRGDARPRDRDRRPRCHDLRRDDGRDGPRAQHQPAAPSWSAGPDSQASRRSGSAS